MGDLHPGLPEEGEQVASLRPGDTEQVRGWWSVWMVMVCQGDTEQVMGD